MRLGKRKANQIRKVQIKPGVLKYAEGSALIRLGNTCVLCAASVSEQVPTFLRETGQGWITAEYSMLPRATHTRSEREGNRRAPRGRTQELQRMIGRSLRAVVDLNKLGPRAIIIDCDVIQADGGTRCAAITAGFVALKLAIDWLLRKKLISEDPVQEYLAAVSVGRIGGETLIDLDYEEDARAEVDCNVVMTESGRLVEIQGTAERRPFTKNELEQMLKFAESGIRELIQCQKKALRRKK